MWFIKRWFKPNKPLLEKLNVNLIHTYRPAFAILVTVTTYYKNLGLLRKAVKYYIRSIKLNEDVESSKKVITSERFTVSIDTFLSTLPKEELIIELEELYNDLMELANVTNYPNKDTYYDRLSNHLFDDYQQLKEGLLKVTNNYNEQKTRYRK